MCLSLRGVKRGCSRTQHEPHRRQSLSATTVTVVASRSFADAVSAVTNIPAGSWCLYLHVELRSLSPQLTFASSRWMLPSAPSC